ncbi:MAG: hypothetical protein ACRDWD_13875 [Acidimicrobiia bacterium]
MGDDNTGLLDDDNSGSDDDREASDMAPIMLLDSFTARRRLAARVEESVGVPRSRS